MKMFRNKYRIITTVDNRFKIQIKNYCYIPFWLTLSESYGDIEYTKHKITEYKTNDDFKPTTIYGD